MSRDSKKKVELTELRGARIVQIEEINSPILRGLAAFYYGRHYPPEFADGAMSIDEAREKFNRDPSSIDRDAGTLGGDSNAAEEIGQIEEVPTRIEDLLVEVMQQDVFDHNAKKRDMYKRHILATTIMAQVLVEAIDPRSGELARFRVVGSWPTLTASLPLTICGERDDSAPGGVPMIRVTASTKETFIGIDTLDSISGVEFANLIYEAGQIPIAEMKTILSRVFSADGALGPPEGDGNEGAVFHSSNAAAAAPQPNNNDDNDAENSDDAENRLLFGVGPIDRSKIKIMPAYFKPKKQSTAAAAKKKVTASQKIEAANTDARKMIASVDRSIQLRRLTGLEFAERCKELGESQLKLLFRAPYIALGLRAAVLNSELAFITHCYGAAVATQMLARGHKYIEQLCQLLTATPEVACISALRKIRLGDSKMRALELLPDLSMESYFALVRDFELGFDLGIVMGIDIYQNIMKRDVYGYDQIYHAAVPGHQGAMYTDSNLFTVFGCPGTDFMPRYYHTPSTEGEDKMSANSMSTYGTFCVPWTDYSKPLDEVDFEALARNINTRELRESLLLDFQRLKHRADGYRNVVVFLRGLYWLQHNGIIVLERFIGTGPSNRGRLVDAFYMSEIYDLHQRFVKVIQSISTCSREQSAIDRRRYGPSQIVPPAVLQLRERVLETQAEWKTAFTTLIKAPQGNAAPVGVGGESGYSAIPHNLAQQAAADAAGPRVAPITALARKIAAEDEMLQKMYEEIVAPFANEVDGPYAEARSVHGYHYSWPLMRIAGFNDRLDGTNAGKKLEQEQIDAIEAVIQEPIVQISGPGGVGKSEVIGKLRKMYPEDQVLAVAFTGQVSSELARRTDAPASTIHLALFRDSMYLEAYFRHRAIRRAQRQDQLKRDPNSRDISEYTRADIEANKDTRISRAYIEHKLGVLALPIESTIANIRALFVDEITLVALPLVVTVLETLHNPLRGRYLQKFDTFGDRNQLQPIGVGSVQSDMAHGLPFTVRQLLVNHRASAQELFNFGRNIALHKEPSEIGIPQYDRYDAFDRLLEADPIVFIESSDATFDEDVREVYRRINATVIDSAVARSIQCISSTREYARRFNNVIRGIYHDREKNDDKFHSRLYMGDRFYLTKNECKKFKNPDDPNGPPLRVYFYNGRLLHVVGVYRGPRKPRADTPCRCMLCKSGDPDFGDCMRRLDQVPPKRRGPSRPDEMIAHHLDGVPSRRSVAAQFLVACDESGNFVEMNVSQMSRPEHGFAVTTHKMQGSQARLIIYECLVDKAFNKWPQPYTAATRPRDRLIIMGSRDVFERMVTRIDPPRRSTLWVHLLRSNSQSPVTLGVWPEPLLSDEENRTRWSHFETIASGGRVRIPKRRITLSELRSRIQEKRLRHATAREQLERSRVTLPPQQQQQRAATTSTL